MNLSLGLIGSSLLNRFGHLDLVAVMLAVASILTLGCIVFFSNPKSATNKAFALFSVFTVLYGSANFFSYKVGDAWQILWLLRLTIFSAVWHAFSFAYLFFVFPSVNARLKRWHTRFAIPFVSAVSVLTLTPLVFSGLRFVDMTGGVSGASFGPAVPLFALTAFLLVIYGLVTLIRKSRHAAGLEKKQIRVVLFGALMTFALILIFNLLLPIIRDNREFIPFAPIWFLPFILFTAHAIRKYRFLETKVLATELFTFALAVISMLELVVAQDFTTLVLRIGVFSGVLVFGIMLIKSVIREVSQRVQLSLLAQELDMTNMKLTELDQIKSQFLSFASHQLRSPLTAIKWQAQLLIDGTTGKLPKEATDTAVEIEESADRLVELVNEFLNLRKLQEGKMQYTFEPTDIAETVSHIVTGLQQLADHKDLKLTFENHASKTLCSVDRQKFTQVIQNLVDNSIKYTDAGAVRVRIEDEAGGFLNILVSDTGHGINADIIDTLFEQYVRDKEDAAKIEGTGLGLYIAKQIMEAHHGRIWATSPGLKKGSTFFVQLKTIAS